MFKRIFLGIVYGFAFVGGLLLLGLSSFLIYRSIVALNFFNIPYNEGIETSKSVYLTVMATSTVGTVASIFQIVSLLKGLVTSYEMTKEESIKQFTNIKTHVEEKGLILEEIALFNKQVNHNFSYSKKDDKFNLKVTYDEYQTILFNSFITSEYLFKLVGEEFYIKTIGNTVPANQQLFDEMFLSKIGENLKLLFEESCRKIDDLLCSYYSGHINVTLFKKFESSYLIELISKLKFYIVLTYERDKKINPFIYNYKYLIKYLKDIIIKRKCFIWE